MPTPTPSMVKSRFLVPFGNVLRVGLRRLLNPRRRLGVPWGRCHGKTSRGAGCRRRYESGNIPHRFRLPRDGFRYRAVISGDVFPFSVFVSLSPRQRINPLASNRATSLTVDAQDIPQARLISFRVAGPDWFKTVNIRFSFSFTVRSLLGKHEF